MARRDTYSTWHRSATYDSETNHTTVDESLVRVVGHKPYAPAVGAVTRRRGVALAR
jgi:hypothetical protein